MKRISEVGRSQRMRIIDTLKKTQGLSVNELGERLKLSYMGVKQHCDELERHGYVDTWRRPKPVGRPEMVYRLDSEGANFFPERDATPQRLKSCMPRIGSMVTRPGKNCCIRSLLRRRRIT